MSKAEDIAKLAAIANLMLDGRLATLRAATRAKMQSEESLRALEQKPIDNSDLMGATAALAALCYQRWADKRRSEINIVLARQSLEWIEARDAAQNAFGKSEVLKGLMSKHLT